MLGDNSWMPFTVPVRPLMPVQHSLIICFFSGDTPPSRSAPMLREPSPPIGGPFDANFPNLYQAAVALNPATHDGAVMVGRASPLELPLVFGWSYRLFSPAQTSLEQANRGSAWNSCLAMSLEDDVDELVLASSSEIFGFRKGSFVKL
jgi:hypothetical protein